MTDNDAPDMINQIDERNIQQDDALARLDALGQALAAKRKEAVEYREQSGVEQIWDEDQDFYDGIDDVNRRERLEKPSTSEGRPMSFAPKTSSAPKSTVFPNITQPYCDMGASSVADMLLPTDDKPFGLKSTPIPELDGFADSGEIHVFPDGTQAQAAEVVKMIREKANEIAQRSEDRIWDWLVESRWHAEVRSVIEDASRIGTGVLKGPVPCKRKIKKVIQDDGGITRIEISEEIRPQSKRIDVRNLYPDPACGESIHNGSYVWERDFITRKQLIALKGGDYLDSQIDKCLEEGPLRSGVDRGSKGQEDDGKKKMYEIWYYNGLIEKDDITAAGCECDAGNDDIPAIITTVNDRVIKAAISPLDSGEFPYDTFPWARRGGSWVGTGIARQVREPQRMLTSATRRLMDNVGLSSGVLFFFRRGDISPADGSGTLAPTANKMYWVEDQDGRRIEDAMHIVEVPSRQQELQAVIQYALDLAERLTSMPLMMQGQQGEASKTVGGMQILNNNAGTVRRRCAKLFDDNITEPHIQRYYEWLLLYGEDKEEKGDSKIDARGSSALFERDTQNQAILGMAPVVKDPDYGINPSKWIDEAFKAQKLDPARFKFSDEEKKKLQEQQAQSPPPVDPRVAGNLEIAKVRADGDMQKAQLNQQSDIAELQLKQKIEADKLLAQAKEAELQRQHDIAMKRMDYEMKLMEFSHNSGLALDEAKVKLADTSMKLATQKELSEKVLDYKDKEGQRPDVPAAKTQVVNPAPSEPAGRAPDMEAFAK